jgi:hypothetical protein
MPAFAGMTYLLVLYSFVKVSTLKHHLSYRTLPPQQELGAFSNGVLLKLVTLASTARVCTDAFKQLID